MIRLQQQYGRYKGPRHGAAAWAVLLALVLFALLAGGAVQAQPVSPAEVLLFETDHLARTRVPSALIYDFRKVSNVEPGFSDTVELDLSREKGQLHARLRFLSGARQRELPEIDDAHGNPVLLGFLEHDIAEMKRLTGGSTGYFRKRIRMALANAAQLGKQPITFGGKSHEAQVIRIQPYLDDPLHARFEAYVRKTYTFVLSDAVPGGVYRISTSLGTGGERPINAAADAAAGAAGGRSAGRRDGEAVQARGADAQSAQARSAEASPAAVRPATPGPTPQAPGVVPQIEETLTLVKVADPKR